MMSTRSSLLRGFWVIFAMLMLLHSASAVELKQVISREHPSFNPAGSIMTVGLDGNVYLGSGDYVLRLSRDGAAKLGGKVVYAMWNMTANKDGIIASANAHFNHSVNLFNPSFQQIGAVSDFLSSDATEWFDPDDVQAGPSGDFYGMDQNRNRIVQVAVPGKMVTTYSLAGTGEDFVRRMVKFRVWEGGKRFYIITQQSKVYALGFDGKVAWTLENTGLGGDPWNGYGAEAAVDNAGNLNILKANTDIVQVYGPDGKLASEIKLQMGERKGRYTGLGVYGDDIIVKRRDPIELFQVYDRNTGALRRVVNADAEQLSVTFPSEIWTAGEAVPLAIDFNPGSRKISPRWHVWLQPFNVPGYKELPLIDGKVTPPKDAGGLYHLKITPGLNGADAEYQVESVIEIRQPGTKGTISLLTPQNRLYYGQGEEIPVTLICRANVDDLPKTLAVRVLDGERTVVEGAVAVEEGKPAQLTISKGVTLTLHPGRYTLTAGAPGFTVAPQTILLGPGILRPPAFSIVQHGDYSLGFPTGNYYQMADNVASFMDRTLKLKTNMFVDRLGHNVGMLNAGSGTDAIADQLKKDPLGTAPEKAQFENITKQSIAAYGANGIEERAILLYMDAGLPIGTLYDGRKPEQMVADLTNATKALLPYPAFRGWSWAANWWLSKHGANAADTPEQKAAYEAALKQANDTGAWDPVLDKVSDIWLNYAVDAEKQFDAALQKIAPGKISAMTGPYRAVTVIPPLTFKNADEIDLQYQAEQIQPPQVTPHNVDFYKRPGKREWGHPELWNDDGTGGMIFPTLLQMVMRGTDGTGWSGNVPPWGTPVSDTRASGQGMVTIMRTLNTLLTQYGPWLTTMKSNDRVAIVVSERMLRLDNWRGIGGEYFTRLYEAYNACLYAHRPASFVYMDDIAPDGLKAYKAVLVVGQRVEMEPKLAAALQAAKAAGVTVFYDGTCRYSLVDAYNALNDSFDKVEKDPSVWQDDSAYARFPVYFKDHARALEATLGKVVLPVAACDNPEIMLTERTAGEGRYLWVVNNVIPQLDPGMIWRVGLLMSQRLPVMPLIGMNQQGRAVYDVFAQKLISGPDTKGAVRVQADLRSVPARLYAILPAPIAEVAVRGPKAVPAGKPFEAGVWVKDAAGKPINAGIPVRVRLLATDGAVLVERFTSVNGAAGLTDVLTIPLNPPPGMLTLAVTELISGKEARLTMAITPAKVLKDFMQPAAQTPVPAAMKVSGKTSCSSFSAPELGFGPHLRDVALSADGQTAMFNAMDWDQNLYAINLKDGSTRWRGRVGQHFAYGPQAVTGGFAVQGYDLNTPEGYHLYLLGADGKPERRFALYGLPKRAVSWAAGWQLLDRINNFAVAPDRAWVASAGDLGLAVWGNDGKLLWSDDWWKRGVRQRALLLAQGSDTLIAMTGMTATAYEAKTGARRWQLTLATTGTFLDGKVSADGKTLALRSDTDGGRIYIVRNGELVNTLTTPADALALTPDGTSVAVTTGKLLKLYEATSGLVWNFEGDDTLRYPKIAPDGKRIAVCSELGTLTVLGLDGTVQYQRDLTALATPAWLPNGDLLFATWMGTVMRLDGKYGEIWHTRLQPTGTEMKPQLLATDTTPTARMAGWGNAAPQPAALTPNLLADTKAIISVVMSGRAQELQNPVTQLTDGKPDAPEKPWLGWTTINYIDSGWSGALEINFDTFHTQLRVTGMTFVEDPQHPESWLRDMRLQYWDAAKEVWVDGPLLLSDSAVHTHMFDKPVEAARFRLVSTGGGTWPAGNIRLGEVVFHGEVLGGSHPDAVAGKPLAVLFDEKESDLKVLQSGFSPQFAFLYEGAYSGGKSLSLKAAGTAGPLFQPPFGHAIPNWLFPITENPKPGEYRWLQFAWKATSPQTTGMALVIGNPWPGGGFNFVAGEHNWGEGVLAQKKVADKPPTEWQVVRVDLWDMLKKPVTIQSMSLATVGGGAAFDQIVLGRTEADLPPIK